MLNRSTGLLSRGVAALSPQLHYAVPDTTSNAAAECFMARAFDCRIVGAPTMTRMQPKGNAAGDRRLGAGQVIAIFFAMAMAEWRKLVGEVQHALSSHRRHRDAAERELFHGCHKLMSKIDDDIPVL